MPIQANWNYFGQVYVMCVIIEHSYLPKSSCVPTAVCQILESAHIAVDIIDILTHYM